MMLTTTMMMFAAGRCCWTTPILVLLLLLQPAYHSKAQQQQQRPLQCSLSEQDLQEHDPNLHEMKYDVGDGVEQTTLVYIEPPITEFYHDDDAPPPATTKVTPKFNGFSGKFINMSNKKLILYWEERVGGKRHEMQHYEPWTAFGTATFPTHNFIFTPKDSDEVLTRITIEDYPENIYVYDPYLVEDDPDATEKNLNEQLNKKEREMYEMWHKTLLFNEQYRNFTGRSYLANYLRPRPGHYMWRADYFGQQHYVETWETHFIQEPPKHLLKPITVRGKKRILKETDPRVLEEYRKPGYFNMTLTVLSVAPRVFQIDNFLSDIEVDHITELASGIKLSLSGTGDASLGGGGRKAKDTTKTRTSYNSWVKREKSPIIDSIYRRAADLMRIDEALLRARDKDEVPEYGGNNRKSCAEDLQLVNYKHGQEYTSHHDFGYSRLGEVQGARFATLLLYLNEGMTGGETTFPRWVNAETFRELEVVPEVGKAILFYSQLPDGNLDDFSQHAAKPVTDGEKWLINLWVWEPEFQ